VLRARRKELVGRESHLASLRGFLDDARVGLAALLLEGEAGIGKTALWREGVAAARERGFEVLACRPVESETQLPFTALGDLVESVPERALSQLQAPRRRALETALLRVEADGPPLHQRAVALGALGVLRHLAEAGPILLAMDDIQWLDSPSARVLEFVLRRLEREPIGVLATQRPATAGEPPLSLERALPEDRLRRLPVGPLELDSLERLLRRRLDARFLHPVVAELHRVSAGNPFFALEIARVVTAPDFELGPGEALPVPPSLRELVHGRLGELSLGARGASLVAAAASRPTRALVEAALGAGGQAADLEAAIEAGVIELEGDRIRLTHPLLSSILYSDASPEQRRELHARLAAVLTDPEDRARHLALSVDAPDANVASALDDAARRARDRGAPDAAAELSEQGRRLTPSDRVIDYRRRTLEAAECHFEAGDTKRARGLLEEVVADSPPGPLRAEALTRLAWVAGHDDAWPATAELLGRALAEAGDDPEALAEIEGGLAWTSHMGGDLPQALAFAHAALTRAETLGDPAALAKALADASFLEFVLGQGMPAEALERAIALGESGDRLRILSRPSWLRCLMLEYMDELDGARSGLELLYRHASEQGDENALPFVLNHLSRVECFAGNWELAARYANESYESTLASGQAVQQTFTLSSRALVDAHLGSVDAVRAAVDEGLRLAERTGVRPATFELLSVLGFLELSLGNTAEAHLHLGPLAKAVAAAGFAEPGVFRFHANEIEALVALGRFEEAEALLSELERQGATLGRAWAMATAGRCRGLLRAALGESREAFAAFEVAFEHHERVPQPFELARSLLALGTVQRRAKKKRIARASLERALEIFDRLGAPLWSQKAHLALERVSGRSPAQAGLTPTETRVAELVAQGRSNQTVADALFMSVKTVEWNLSKIYRKLGIRSRGQLAAIIGLGQDSRPRS
jgi:DNA-binding CsgD family transcriptional regulator